jgi:hypothetical protein
VAILIEVFSVSGYANRGILCCQLCWLRYSVLAAMLTEVFCAGGYAD